MPPVRVKNPQGQTGTIDSSELHQSLKNGWTLAGQSIPQAPQPQAPSGGGFTGGLISGDTISRAATGMTPQALTQMRDQPAYDQSPAYNFAKTMAAGTVKDASDTLSSFTSPASLLTMGLGRLGQVPNAIGKIATVANTGLGLGFGAKGAYDLATSHPTQSPEEMQKALLGASMMAGSAGSLQQAGRAIKSPMDAVLPEGTNAVISALKPTGKAMKTIRENIDAAAPEIQSASPKSLEEFKTMAADKRQQAGKDIDQAIQTAGGSNLIDGNSLKQSLSPVSRVIQAQNPNAQAGVDKFVNNLIANPITVADADVMIKDLTAQQASLRGMTPAEKSAALKQDPSLLSVDQIKKSLVGQIDQKLSGSGLSDARKKYAVWSALDDAASHRYDQVAKQDPVSWVARRALETGGATAAAGVGAALGGGHDLGAMAGLAGVGAGAAKIGTDFYINKLNSPDYLISRGAKTMGSQQQRPVNLGGNTAAAIASGVRP
jgi:hypothetical protein